MAHPFDNLQLHRRLARSVWPYWHHLAGLLALSALSPALALLVPLPLRIAIDHIVGGRPLTGFVAACVPAGLAQNSTGLLVATVLLVVVVALLAELRDFASAL